MSHNIEKHEYQLAIPFSPESFTQQIENRQNPEITKKYSNTLKQLASISNRISCFHLRFGVSINLSSLNKVALILKDSQNHELKLNWGNTKDQFEVFQLGKVIYSGMEFEFNSSKFNQDIWIEISRDSLKIVTFSESLLPQKIENYNRTIHRISIPLNSMFSSPIWAIFQISQSGKSAIGAHHISQINWIWGAPLKDSILAITNQIANNKVRVQIFSKSNWLLSQKPEFTSFTNANFSYTAEETTIKHSTNPPNSILGNIINQGPTILSDPFLNYSEFEIAFKRTLNSQKRISFTDTVYLFLKTIPREILYTQFQVKLPQIQNSHFQISNDSITGKFTLLNFDTAEVNAVFSTEIMSDTKPNYGRLPEFQYIEIFNSSTNPIDLNTIYLSKSPKFKDAKLVGNRLNISSVLSNTSLSSEIDKTNWQFQKCLPAKQCAILVSISDSTAWKQWIKQTTKSKLHSDSLILIASDEFPRLNLTDGSLHFFNPLGKLIYSMSYSKEMVSSEFKEGGVSIELLDTQQPFSWMLNAKSNSNFGGSPGCIEPFKTEDFPNHQKTITYKIEDAYCSEDSIYLIWNHSLPCGFPSIYLKKYPSNNPISIDSIKLTHRENISTAKWSNSFNKSPCKQGDTFNLCLENAMINSNKSSNQVLSSLNKNQIIHFHSGDSKLLRFNEIMNHNFTGFADFFELVNNDSIHSVDLENWDLLYYDEYNLLKLIIPLKNQEFRFIPPKEFRVFTDDKYSVYRQFPFYYPFHFAQISSIPDINISTGKWVLNHHIDGIQDEIDLSALNKSFPSLTKGFSLEKMHPTLASSDPQSWFPYFESDSTFDFKSNSPSTIPPSGATPGENNSHTKNPIINDEWVFLPQKVIDSQTDNRAILPIEFHLPRAGYLLNAAIYNASGRQLKVLPISNPLPASGSLFLNLSPEIHFNGNYVIKFEAHLNGSITKRSIQRITAFQ